MKPKTPKRPEGSKKKQLLQGAAASLLTSNVLFQNDPACR